jgi:hypothetical protein
MATLRILLDYPDAPRISAATTALPHRTGVPARKGSAGAAEALHPIQAVCGQVFEGRLSDFESFAEARVLIRAGLDLTHCDLNTGDSLVTTAIGLSARSVAHALLDAGAPHALAGRFGARPLHWAAIMGMPDLLERLLPDADLAERDRALASTPLGWALEGWASPPRGSHSGHAVCAAALVEAGAVVDTRWRDNARVRHDCALRAALRL